MNIFGLAKASTWTKLSLDVFGSVAQAESWTRCQVRDTRNGKTARRQCSILFLSYV